MENQEFTERKETQRRREEWWLDYLRSQIDFLEKSRPSFWRGAGILAPSIVALTVGIFGKVEWHWWIALLLIVLGILSCLAGAFYLYRVRLRNQEVERQKAGALTLIDGVLMGVAEDEETLLEKWEKLKGTYYSNPLRADYKEFKQKFKGSTTE